MKGNPLTELAFVLESKLITENAGVMRGFEIDSRKIEPGFVFFALKGEKVDGHRFLSEVSKKGALAAVVSSDYEGKAFGMSLIYVDDVLTALQKAARVCFSKRTCQVVGVTGSVGKTTTKEFIATLLEGKYRVAKTPGNSNSQVGVPLSILNGEGTEEVLVLEMGMSAPEEIATLVQIAPPDIGVVTQIGRSHAEFFKEGIQGIAKAKAEIFSHSKTKIAILPANASQYEAFSQLKQPQCFFYGGDSPLHDYVLQKREYGTVIVERGIISPALPLSFQASHLLENFAAAVAVARILGMTWEEISTQAAKLVPFKRRFESIEKEGILFIDDSYNASPESMCAALKNLPQPSLGKKRIAVFGEMKELGSHTLQGHQEVAECAFEVIDHALCFGKATETIVDHFSGKCRPAELFQDLSVLKLRLKELAQRGDVVLLKGSNSNGLWRLLEEEFK